MEWSRMEKETTESPRRRFNMVLLIGMWTTIVTACIWAGGYLIGLIKVYLPWCLGLGIAILAGGLYLEMRKAQEQKIRGPE